LRFSVRQQRNEFRNSISLPTRCSISDRIISNRAELHIDHKVPFWKVVSQFCRENEIDLNSLSTVGSGEELKLTDDIVQLKFQEFHQTNAKLQATQKEVNLQMGGKFDEA
jgi:predicted nucleic acid binding AN1-type Zn finger protein